MSTNIPPARLAKLQRAEDNLRKNPLFQHMRTVAYTVTPTETDSNSSAETTLTKAEEKRLRKQQKRMAAASINSGGK